MPREGAITATIDVLSLREQSGVKVRMVIWSGQDFRTPTIKRGGIFADAEKADEAAARLVEACVVLGIPVEDRPSRDALLPEIPEGSEYPNV